MKTFGSVLLTTLVGGVVVALSFPGDRIETQYGRLGPELVRAVEVCGRVLAMTARPSADDLIKSRGAILTSVDVELSEVTISISQILVKLTDRPPLDLGGLDPVKRREFVELFPANRRESILAKKQVEFDLVLEAYKSINERLWRDAKPFMAALARADASPTIAQVNEIGKMRGAFTGSLGRLVQFSGQVQELAFSIERS